MLFWVLIEMVMSIKSTEPTGLQARGNVWQTRAADSWGFRQTLRHALSGLKCDSMVNELGIVLLR